MDKEKRMLIQRQLIAITEHIKLFLKLLEQDDVIENLLWQNEYDLNDVLDQRNKRKKAKKEKKKGK